MIRISKQSTLYKKDLYLNKDIDYIINRKITEYDIKNAGLNICKYYNLLPNSILDKLSNMNKNECHIALGKLQRDDKNLAKALSKGFKHMRKEFLMANRIYDSDILSIKKDAIFIVGKKCKVCEFDNVTFVEKNVYTSYHNLNGLEFYYSSSKDILDIKGINNDSLYQYTLFLNVLKRLFRLLETNREEFIKFMKRFSEDYKNKNLTYDYYRELRPNGSFSLIQDPNESSCITLDGMDETVHDRLSIQYNYLAFILPLIRNHYFNEIS